MRYRKYVFLTAIAAAVVWIQPASAQRMEKVRVTTSFLGLWDTSQPTFCKARGEFAKAGLDVEITNNRGGSENVQAVTVGGMDIGYSPGTNSVLAAYAQGAKIKIISAEFKGQNDTFFYVPADSPIKSINDLKGKSVSFPRPGGASEALLLSLKHERNLDIKMVATGGLDATYTMVMTRQVDVGYSFPPSMIAAVDKGDIRVVFAGDEVKSQKDLTGRVIIARDDFLKNRRAVAIKFLQVLDSCIDWTYANQAEATKMYAELNKVDPSIAAKAVSFYKRETLAFGPISGMNTVMKQAVQSKFIQKPLTPAQIKDLVDIIYTPQVGQRR